MCSSKRAINNQVSLVISAGPATLAVARESKRQRTCEEQKSKGSSSFDLDSLFRSVPLNEEAFPTIEWAFDDDESDDQPTKTTHSSCDSFFKEDRKRTRDGGMCGIHRSKALLSGLSSLSEEQEQVSESAAIAASPLTPESIKPLMSTLFDQFSMINSVSMPIMSRKLATTDDNKSSTSSRFPSSNTLREFLKESLIDFDAAKKLRIATSA